MTAEADNKPEEQPEEVTPEATSQGASEQASAPVEDVVPPSHEAAEDSEALAGQVEGEAEAEQVEESTDVAPEQTSEPESEGEAETAAEEAVASEAEAAEAGEAVAEGAAGPEAEGEAEPEEPEEEKKPARKSRKSRNAAEKAVEEALAEQKVEEAKTPRWYILRVQSNQEDSVRESLEKRVAAAGLQDKIPRILVPTEKVSEIKGGQKRVTEHKIYPGYVMVEMILDDETWYLIRETPKVGDFLGGAPNTRPPAMRDEEVDKVLGQAEGKETEQPKLKIEFREGESVKITEGPFENFSGIVEEVLPAKGLVKVVVTIFGRPTPVELEYWQIEAI